MSLISHTPEACRGLVDGGLPAKISIVRLVFGPGRLSGMYYLPPPSSPIVLAASAPFCHHVNTKGALELRRGKKGALSAHLPGPGPCARHGEGQGQRWKEHEDVSQGRLRPGYLAPEWQCSHMTRVLGTQRGVTITTGLSLHFSHSVNTRQSDPCYSLHPVSLACSP